MSLQPTTDSQKANDEARRVVKEFNQRISKLISDNHENTNKFYENFRFSPNDVIVVGYPKSGTNWMENICHQIKMRGNDEDFEELKNETSYLDQPESKEGGSIMYKKQKGEFKIFNSHFAFFQLPEKSKKAKFVIIIREPHDTFASLCHWEPRFMCEMAPYADSITAEIVYQERLVVDSHVQRISRPESKYPVLWWDFLESWLTNHNKVNSIFVLYQDLITDFSAQLDRISSFLGVPLTEKEKQNVTYLSSFEYMKANNSKFNFHSLRTKFEASFAEMTGEAAPKTDIPVFVSKGATRNGREELNDTIKSDMEAKWKVIIEAKFGFKNFEEMCQSLKN